MSNIEQQRSLALRHAGRITACPRPYLVTESSVMLPPHRRYEAMHELLRSLTASEFPWCAQCQARMTLVGTSPGPIGFQHRLFKCPNSDHVEAIVLPLDPFKSNALGWLSGQRT